MSLLSFHFVPFQVNFDFDFEWNVMPFLSFFFEIILTLQW